MKRFIKALEDNAGGLYLAVLIDKKCVAFFSGFEFNIGSLFESYAALMMGGSFSGWDNNSETPNADYASFTAYQFDWEIIANDCGVYPEKFGRAATLDYNKAQDFIRPSLHGFAEACFNYNSMLELRQLLLSRAADKNDCRSWKIKPTQWRSAIQCALTAKIFEQMVNI